MGFFDKTNRQVSCIKNIRGRLGGVNAMKNFLGIDETPPVLERSFKAATKLKCELPTYIKITSIPLVEIASLAEDIHAKTRETSQSTNLHTQEFFWIVKVSQTIHGELVNNTSKINRD